MAPVAEDGRRLRVRAEFHALGARSTSLPDKPPCPGYPSSDVTKPKTQRSLRVLEDLNAPRPRPASSVLSPRLLEFRPDRLLSARPYLGPLFPRLVCIQRAGIRDLL